jgi:hypothetical protein
MLSPLPGKPERMHWHTFARLLHQVRRDYGERRFTLGKGATGLEVLDMTGPQRTSRG